MFEENFVSYHFRQLLSPKGTSATSVQAPVVAFTVFSLPRAWLEPPRKKTTSCGVSRLMGLTIVRPPKCICYSRWSQPTYVQRNLNRLVTSERLNNFILYLSGFQSNYCFMKLIHLFYFLVLHHISIII